MPTKLNLTEEERFKRYMDNVKKANRKYIETHREQINERSKNYYHKKYATNEEFRERKRAAEKERYWKKKEQKLQEQQEKSEEI